MALFVTPPLIRCFLLKVASRCNINCDYCYMYNHLDQSWKSQPKLMSEATLAASADRISEYVIEHQLDRIAVVYHGGEPLLLDTMKLIDHAKLLRAKIPPSTLIDFSLQTNGVLLKENHILLFREHKIQVSLSIDGPESANDRHRLDHQGKSTFAETEAALKLLEKYPDVFAGIISVIDPQNDPRSIFSFFAKFSIPQLDFLLPDANYLTPPPARELDPDIYIRWLINCFDIWFDNYSEIKVRTFDSILASLFGAPSETDGFGFGDVSLITIETDGTYHDLDVLKITGEGTHLSKGSVYTDSLEQAISSELVSRHRNLLKKEGLSIKCRDCEVVDICGGGAVAHRFNEEGFSNPSIYCLELKGLIEHASKRVSEQLSAELESSNVLLVEENVVKEYEYVTGISPAFAYVLNAFKTTQGVIFRRVLSYCKQNNVYENEFKSRLRSPELESKLDTLAIHPAVVAWTEVIEKERMGVAMRSIDGKTLPVDYLYITNNSLPTNWPSFQSDDPWLRLPFGDKIYFEDKGIVERGWNIITEALSLIKSWKPEILDEMQLISPEILFIRDLEAPPDRVVSFSDNSVPGALYVQLTRLGEFIDSSDLADSIIHEHRHQKLYLLQRVCPIVNADYPLVPSPWREELRPPTGLFHALYVFVELLDFWTFHNRNSKISKKARINCKRISEQLETGFKVVESCDLTDNGGKLLALLKDKYNSLIS